MGGCPVEFGLLPVGGVAELLGTGGIDVPAGRAERRNLLREPVAVYGLRQRAAFGSAHAGQQDHGGQHPAKAPLWRCVGVLPLHHGSPVVLARLVSF